MKPQQSRARRSERVLLSLAVLAAAFYSATDLSAADKKTISVVGVGTIPVIPDQALIPGVIAGSAEMATDAFKKFQQNQKRVQDAFAKLKIEGLTFEGEALVIHIPNAAQRVQGIVYGTENGDTGTNMVVFYQSFQLKLTGVDKLSEEKLHEILVKIVDAGRDAAVIIGSSPDESIASLAKFQYGKTKEAQMKALELAAQDARAKGERLGKLLGVQLGTVVSASEIASGDSSDYTDQLAAYRMAMQHGMQGYIPGGSTRKSLNVTATINVEFEIVK